MRTQALCGCGESESENGVLELGVLGRARDEVVCEIGERRLMSLGAGKVLWVWRIGVGIEERSWREFGEFGSLGSGECGGAENTWGLTC